MYSGTNFEADLALAEEGLKKAEETYGPNHVNVSYCLDAVVKLLRSKGIRPLDSANMEARARAIRIQINTGQMQNLTPQARDISEAIRTAAKRKEKEKAARTRKLCIGAVAALVCLLILAKILSSPSPATQGFLKQVNKVMPTTMFQNMIQKTQSTIADTEAKTKKHNQAIEKILGDEPPSAESESGGSEASTETSGDTAASDTSSDTSSEK